MQLKKIGAVLVGATMLASSMGMASAYDLSTYPTGFADSSAVTSVIVVGSQGTSAAGIASDVVGAINIGASLAQAGAGTQTATCEAAAAGAVTEGKQIQTAAKNLYLEADLNSVQEAALTDEDMPIALGSGTLTNNESTDYTYTQYVTVGNATTDFSEQTDAENPTLYLKADSTRQFLTAKFILDDDITWDTMAGKTITLFGQEFTLDSDTSKISNTKLVLYGGGAKITVNAAGDAVTTTLADGTEVTVSMPSWTSGSEATFTVNGVTDTYREGSYISISGSDSRIYVKNIVEVLTPSAAGAATQSAYAELFVGSDRLVVENNKVIKSGKEGSEESVDGTYATVSTSEIDYIWKGDSPQTEIAAGGSMADPAFGAFKVQFDGASPDLTASSREVISLEKDGSRKLVLKFTDATGNAVTMPVAYFDDTSGAELAEKKHSTGYDLTLNESVSMNQYDYFVVTNTDTGTAVFQVIDFNDDKNETTIKNLGTGSSKTLTYRADTTLDKIRVAGNAFTFALSGQNDGDDSNTQITVDMDGSETIGDNGNIQIYGDKLANMSISLSGNTTTVVMQEDPGADYTNQKTGNTVTSVFLYDATTDKRWEVQSVTLGDGNSDDQLGTTDKYQALTEYGTFVEFDKDSQYAKMYYSAAPTEMLAYVGATDMAVGAAAEAGTVTVTCAVPDLGTGIATTDADVTASEKNENLILVGGPAVNSLVAELAAAGKTMTVDDWRAVDDSGAAVHTGEAIIEAVDGFAAGKTAIVVAGYAAADTRNAASVLTNYQTYSLSGSKCTVTAATPAGVSCE